MVVCHEVNVNRKAAFVDELASKPFVEDVFDRVTLTTVLDAQSDRVSRFEEKLEGLAIVGAASIWETLARRRGNRDQCTKKSPLAMATPPEKHRILETFSYTHVEHSAWLGHGPDAAINRHRAQASVLPLCTELSDRARSRQQ